MTRRDGSSSHRPARRPASTTTARGPIIVDWLNQRGFATPAPVVVADGSAVVRALFAAVGENVDVMITSGGTGISPTDRTADATANIVDYQIPGLADAIRRSGLPNVPTSVLSRGVCGVRDGTLIVNLPGSTGGVSDGLGVLDDVLEHALDQLAGKDHTQMTAVVLRADLTDQTIELAEHEDLVAHQAAGAVVGFAGVVRDHDGGRSGDQARVLRAPDGAADARRGGRRDRGRLSAVCGRSPSATASAPSDRRRGTGRRRRRRPSRAAFDTCARLVDTVKARLPVWKHQFFADGSDEWVGSA